MSRAAGILLAVAALVLAAVRPAAADATDNRQLICQTIAEAAAANGLPVGFFARLLWTESGFRSTATSPAGAQGIAQFMPATAAARGLADPRDPLQAIRHAARLLFDLNHEFGNLGLAAAAYDAGEARVAKWLQGGSGLPVETRLYVTAITGKAVEEWAAWRGSLVAANYPLPGLDCLSATASATAGAARRGPFQAELPPFPAFPIYRTTGDRHLAGVVNLLGSLSRDEAGQTVAATGDTAGAWQGRRRAAEALCAAFRAGGAACTVFGN